MSEKHTFQAEIKQLLNILAHSLYKDREIFLRELISNASDALNKIQFEMLTNKDVLDAGAELFIEIHLNPEKKTLRVVDSGIGMTHDEMITHLGVIAQSGAKTFLAQLEDSQSIKHDLIGQFGVGFYSVFMVADRVEVTSRSFRPDEPAHTWICSGEDSYEIIPAEKKERGTEVLLHLRDDATEFTSAWQIRQIIKRHSDYIAFPIYVIDESAEQKDEKPEPVNQQIAIWRRPINEIQDQEYEDFYRSLTLDFEKPALRIHTQGDAPIQYSALLYIPAKAERGILSLRKEAGLKLYARKVLIQEYCTDLLPEYLSFVQGVVDSEDLPLNVSRETVQANPQMAKLKQVITRKVLSELKKLSEDNPEAYAKVWSEYSTYLKHGIISEYSDRERLLPLLRFYSSASEQELTTLQAYVERMKGVEGQTDIYYITADSIAAATRSPHLDPFRARGIEVLYLIEGVDGFFVNALREYEGHKLVNVDAADLDLSGVGKTPEEETPPLEEKELDPLLVRVRNVLGDTIESARVSKVMLGSSPVRLVAPAGSLDRHTQRVYQMLEKDFKTPARILEINPRHPIIQNLVKRLGEGVHQHDFVDDSIHLLYESALLADGVHPNPADLVPRLQAMLEIATRV